MHRVPVMETGSAWLLLGVFAFPLMAGLFSGFTHCAAMCGPIHLFIARRGGNRLWLYHAGRVVSYAGLGAAAGALAGSIRVPGAAWAWVALYLLLGLRLMGVPLWPSGWGVRYGAWIMARLRPLTVRAMAPESAGHPRVLFMLGLAAGFLPCATTQAGLAWAAGTASPVTGGAGMLLLGAGTMPLFLAWPRRWLPRGKWFHIALGLGLLALAAWKICALLIPPSPALGVAPLCH